MEHNSEAFIGIDTSKLKNAVAIAEGGRDGEVRYLGEIDTTDGRTRKLVANGEVSQEQAPARLGRFAGGRIGPPTHATCRRARGRQGRFAPLKRWPEGGHP